LLASQVIIGTVLGIPGIIIATPLTITVIVIIQRTYIEDFLGDSVKVLGET
jgi:predicted PurR-regulated permease PerM